MPELLGHEDFRGRWFHAAAWDSDFDPAGHHVAVVGTDTTAGQHLSQLAGSAASVTVFAYPPRRLVPRPASRVTRATRWLRCRVPGAPVLRAQQHSPKLVNATIDAVTPAGIRTCDGVHHNVDTIIYGTGFTIPDGVSDDTLVGSGKVTIAQAWYDGMEPYLGVAVHGFPNYFLLTGPDIDAQTRFIIECLGLMAHTAKTRIEVRRSYQQVFNERVHLRRPRYGPAPSAFDLSCAADGDGAYDGPATLTITGTDHEVRVRLTGYLDPIDGQYHWQGMVFHQLSDDLVKHPRPVTVTIGQRSASARLTERTPWGSHAIAGVGMPPFAPDNALTVGQLPA
ncbi:DUF4873 domain-containing protein [Mycobacterium botniense]|uniref:DUF4873 domain-containing protein n=1 Tax=Mycobacterium botniense TaxID=84962 RepID=UPI001FE9839D|nr:DUF4873 domain-containing protein [Mycobacterium botniense]